MKSSYLSFDPLRTMELQKVVSGTQLVLLSDQQKVEILRPELNIEKHSSFLFPQPKTKWLDDVRVMRWTKKLGDGTEYDGEIKVEPSKTLGCCTVRTRSVYLAITEIFYQQGMPDWAFTTSIHAITKAMWVPANGKWYEIIDEELNKMYKTTITWTLSFDIGEVHPKSVNNQQILSVYDYVSMSQRIDQTTKFEKLCRIDFDPEIKENLKKQRTAPLNLTTRKSITSSIQKVLYDMVDIFLTSQHHTGIFERRALWLIDDLNISPARYEYMSRRKTLLMWFKEGLDGKLLSNLKKLKVSVLLTADEKDWKCRFQAINTENVKPKWITHMTPKNTDSSVIESLLYKMGNVVTINDKK
jgi:hypothetical protein